MLVGFPRADNSHAMSLISHSHATPPIYDAEWTYAPRPHPPVPPACQQLNSHAALLVEVNARKSGRGPSPLFTSILLVRQFQYPDPWQYLQCTVYLLCSLWLINNLFTDDTAAKTSNCFNLLNCPLDFFMRPCLISFYSVTFFILWFTILQKTRVSACESLPLILPMETFARPIMTSLRQTAWQ